MNQTRRNVMKVAVLALLLLFAVGCSKVNQANFDKIENGMTKEEVQKILGAPHESGSFGVGPLSGTLSKWKSGETSIHIQFFNGKVRSKQLFKGEEAKEE